MSILCQSCVNLVSALYQSCHSLHLQTAIVCQRCINLVSTLCQYCVNLVSTLYQSLLTLCQSYFTFVSILCQPCVNLVSALCQHYIRLVSILPFITFANSYPQFPIDVRKKNFRVRCSWGDMIRISLTPLNLHPNLQAM